MPGPGLRSQVLPPGNLPHDEMEPVSIENNKQKQQQQQQQLQQQQQQQHSNGDGMVECKACGDRFAQGHLQKHMLKCKAFQEKYEMKAKSQKDPFHPCWWVTAGFVVWTLATTTLSVGTTVLSFAPAMLKASKFKVVDNLWIEAGNQIGAGGTAEFIKESIAYKNSMDNLPGQAILNCIHNGGQMPNELQSIPMEVIENAIIHGMDLPVGYVRPAGAAPVLVAYVVPPGGYQAWQFPPPIHPTVTEYYQRKLKYETDQHNGHMVYSDEERRLGFQKLKNECAQILSKVESMNAFTERYGIVVQA